MNGSLKRAAIWFDRLNRALAWLGCALMVLVTVAICIEILTRWLLDVSNNWLVELSEIMLLYTTFMGAAWVLGKDGHVSLDVFLDRIPRKGRYRLHLVLAVVAAAACFIMVWFGVAVALDQWQHDIREPTVMAPRTFWITSIIPFGFLLLGVQFLRRAVRAALGQSLVIDALAGESH